MNKLSLSRTTPDDLHTLFQFQLDEDAGYLAAFIPKDPSNKSAYIEKYTRHIADPSINMQTIRLNDVIVGSIAKFVLDEAEITYWIDKPYWGQGVASAALRQFLQMEQTRPINARVAFDNFGSQKVLEKCGFERIGSDKGFANARQMEIEEFIYRL